MRADELTDAWEAAALGRSLAHVEHVQIARVLVLRHGRAEAEQRLVAGTRRNCEAAGVPERFDEDLTRRWAAAIADAIEQVGGAPTFEQLLRARPDLGRGDLLGRPSWTAD